MWVRNASYDRSSKIFKRILTTTVAVAAILGSSAFSFAPSVNAATTCPPASAAWTSTDPHAQWGNAVNGSNGQYNINNNEWSNDHGPQTIWANNFHSWGVCSTQGPTTDVKVYPNVETPFYNLSSPVPYSGVTSMVSTFNQTMPPTSDNYIGESAYDLWLNDWATEVMVWVDNHNQVPAGHVVATLNSYGRTYKLWATGTGVHQTYSFADTGNRSSGTVHIQALIRYLVNHNYIPNTSTYTSDQFGWEICSTNNVTLPFTVNNYSLKTTPAQYSPGS